MSLAYHICNSQIVSNILLGQIKETTLWNMNSNIKTDRGFWLVVQKLILGCLPWCWRSFQIYISAKSTGINKQLSTVFLTACTWNKVRCDCKKVISDILGEIEFLQISNVQVKWCIFKLQCRSQLKVHCIYIFMTEIRCQKQCNTKDIWA